MTVQNETTRRCEEKRGARMMLGRCAAARTSLRRRFALFGLMVATLFGVAVCGWGAETNSATAKAGDEAAQDEREPRSRWDWLRNPGRWDARHDFVSAGVIGAVDRIDQIFGDERLDDDTRLSRLHVKVGGLPLTAGPIAWRRQAPGRKPRTRTAPAIGSPSPTGRRCIATGCFWSWLPGWIFGRTGSTTPTPASPCTWS